MGLTIMLRVNFEIDKYTEITDSPPMDTLENPSPIHFRVNSCKALEVILWLANKQPGLGFHAILKLIFFADKYHLNRYGRPIVGDRYVAMHYGPVASVTYDILKGDLLAIEMTGEDPLPFGVRHQANRPHVYPNRPARLDLLSESDMEALAHAFATYGHLGFDELYQITHDDPAYRSAEKRGLNTTIRYEDLIEDSGHREEIIQDLRETALELVF